MIYRCRNPGIRLAAAFKRSWRIPRQAAETRSQARSSARDGRSRADRPGERCGRPAGHDPVSYTHL